MRRFLAAALLCASGCLAANPYRRLAERLAAPLSASPRRVAVLPFRGVDPALNTEGEAASERLLTQLYGRRGVDLVERSRLQQVFAELGLGRTGALDAKTVAEVGRLAGAEALVVGTVARARGGLALSVRVVEVASGRLLAAADARILETGTRGGPAAPPRGETTSAHGAALRAVPPGRTPWTPGVSIGAADRLPWALATHGVAVLDRRLYVVGGSSPRVKGAGLGDSAVMSAAFAGNGSLREWRTEEALPEGRYQVGAAAWDRWLFAVGGHQGRPRSEVFVSEVGVDGRLGAWRVAGALPSSCVAPGVVAVGGFLHVAGCAHEGGADAAVETAPISAQGALGPWRRLPVPGLLGNPGLVFREGFLLALGGVKASGGYGDSVFRISLGADGYPFRSDLAGRMQEAASGFATALVGSRLWVAGGYVNRGAGSRMRPEAGSVHWAPVSANGTLGPWREGSANLAEPIAMTAGASAGGLFLVVGGEGASGNSDLVQRFSP